MSVRTLDGLDGALALAGWTCERSPKDHPAAAHTMLAWYWHCGELNLWASHVRGVGSYVLAEADGPGRWLWRVEIDGGTQETVLRAAVAAMQYAGDEENDPGRVFGALVAAGWSLECGLDEVALCVLDPAGGTEVRNLPESAVDPGSWLVIRSEEAPTVASAGTPADVVLALADAV